MRQLEPRPDYLYMYLDSLFDKDSQLVLPFSDRMIELYSHYDRPRLLPFLRASNFYDLEKVSSAPSHYTPSSPHRHTDSAKSATMSRKWSSCLAEWGTTSRL